MVGYWVWGGRYALPDAIDNGHDERCHVHDGRGFPRIFRRQLTPLRAGRGEAGSILESKLFREVQSNY